MNASLRTVLLSPLLLLVLVGPAGCGSSDEESCDFKAHCGPIGGTEDEVVVDCTAPSETGDAECRCIENGVEFATCTSVRMCFNIYNAGDRNQANADLVPRLNSCCGTSYEAVQFDFSVTPSVQLNDGCDIRQHSAAPPTP